MESEHYCFYCSSFLPWRITEPWKGMVAPGWEHEDGENTYLTRVGTSYEFEIGDS